MTEQPEREKMESFFYKREAPRCFVYRATINLKSIQFVSSSTASRILFSFSSFFNTSTVFLLSLLLLPCFCNILLCGRLLQFSFIWKQEVSLSVKFVLLQNVVWYFSINFFFYPAAAFRGRFFWTANVIIQYYRHIYTWIWLKKRFRRIRTINILEFEKMLV